jgi:hypothetical protein
VGEHNPESLYPRWLHPVLCKVASLSSRPCPHHSGPLSPVADGSWDPLCWEVAHTAGQERSGPDQGGTQLAHKKATKLSRHSTYAANVTYYIQHAFLTHLLPVCILLEGKLCVERC